MPLRVPYLSPELGRRFSRFIAAGSIGTAAHYALLVICVELGDVRPGVAAGMGAGVGAIVNYLLNYHYTFRRVVTHGRALPRFFTIAALGMLANGGIVAIGVFSGLHYLLAQIMATVVVLVAGFTANNAWTFAQSPRHANVDDCDH